MPLTAGTVASPLPEAWALRGELRPAIRRGFLVAVPVATFLVTDLEVDDVVAGGLGTAAMVCGFIAFDAPARVRVRWQLLCAPLAELLGDGVIVTTLVLTVAVALAFALLTIEYALFTTAITIYVVLLTDKLGASAFDAAGERALGTALGIAVAALAFRAFSETDGRAAG